MANNAFLNETVYAKAFLLLLKNTLVMGRLVDGQFKNQVTDQNGLTVNVKRPPRFVAQDGEALSLQPIVTGSVPVAVDTYKNVHVDVGDLESVQSYNELLHNEVMKSAASELANNIDTSLHDALLEFGSSVGTPGNVIGSPLQFNKVHTRLMAQSTPSTDLNAVLTYDDGEQIRGALIGGNIQDVNRSALERARIPMMSEINAYATNNTTYLTSGTRTNGTVAGAAQNVNYRDVKDTNQQNFLLAGLGAVGTVKRGDTFTIANVYAVNTRSRQILPYLKQFVVLADATADGAGAATVVISPAIIVGGTSDGIGTITNTAFQTVGSIPANAAVVTWTTSASSINPIRAAFHKRAISLVSARLRMPFTGVASFITDKDTGLGIRYWRGSDISTGRHIHRWDVIYGVDNVQRELGARVSGT